MINEQNVNFLSQIWGLFETVREGADHLAGHPENEQKRADVVTGLRAFAEKCGFTVREYQVSNRYNGSMELILTKVV